MNERMGLPDEIDMFAGSGQKKVRFLSQKQMRNPASLLPLGSRLSLSLCFGLTRGLAALFFIAGASPDLLFVGPTTADLFSHQSRCLYSI